MPRVLNLFSAMAFAMLLTIGGCDTFEGETILSYNDPDAAVKVDVRSQLYGGKTRVHLVVSRAGEQRRMVVASGVTLQHPQLVSYNDWLLVCAGNYVIGGYNIDSDRIVPMNSDALPFTVRHLSGYVVDEITLGPGDDVPPINFRERDDPRQ